MSRASTMRRIVVATAIALLVLLVLALVWPQKPSAVSIALDAKLAQLRADGVPLTAGEIARVLSDPDSAHDGRNVLREAFAAPRGPAGGDIPIIANGIMPMRTNAFSESTMQSMQLFLSYSDSMLGKIPEQLEGVWFSMGWTNGFTNLVQFPLIEVRNVIQTLAVKALFEAERGNGGKATEALSKGFSVAAMLNIDSLVSTMMRVASAGVMCDAAERTLNRVQLSDNDLLEIDRRINVGLIDNFEHTFMIERHVGTIVLDPARRGRDYLGRGTVKLLVWKFAQLFQGQRKKFYRDEDYLLFLNVIDERRAVHRRSGLERVRRNEQLDAYYATNTQSLTAEMVMPNWKAAIRVTTQTKARLVALKTALAVERYRLSHSDALPDTLDALVPQYLPSPPRDAMDEQPLRYKKLPRGYVLYSIGADGIDNGGVERGSLTNNYDLTIIIER
jgi:hypothetical protein